MYSRLSLQWPGPSTRQSIATGSTADWPTRTPRMLAGVRRLSPCLRRVKGIHIAAAASSDASTGGVAHASKVWTAVVAGGQQEAETNFQDAQGAKCTYSQFAAWGLRTVADSTTTSNSSNDGGMSELKQQMQAVAEQFDQYTALQQQQRHELVHHLLQEIRPKVDGLLAVLADTQVHHDSMPAATTADTGQVVAAHESAPSDSLLQQPAPTAAAAASAVGPADSPLKPVTDHDVAAGMSVAASPSRDDDGISRDNDGNVTPTPVLQFFDHDHAAVVTTTQEPQLQPAAAAAVGSADSPLKPVTDHDATAGMNVAASLSRDDDGISRDGGSVTSTPELQSSDHDQAAVVATAQEPQPTAAAAAVPAVSRPSSFRPPKPRPRTVVVHTHPSHLQNQQQQQQQYYPASRQTSSDMHSEQQPQSLLHEQQQQQQQQHRLQPSLSSLPPARPKPRPRRSLLYQLPAVHQPVNNQYGIIGSTDFTSATNTSSSSSSRSGGLPKPLLVSPDNAAAVAAGLAKGDPTAAAAAAAAPGHEAAKVLVAHPPVRRPPPRLRSAAPVKRLQQQQQQLIPPWQIYFGPPPHLAPAGVQFDSATNMQSSSSAGLDASSTFAPQANIEEAASAAGNELHGAVYPGDDSEDQHGVDQTTGGSSSSLEDKRLRSEATWNAFVAAAKANEERKAKQAQISLKRREKIKQRTRSWHRSRKGRLTGSSLCNMLGWFNNYNSWRASQDGGAPAVPEQVVLWRDLVGIEKKTFAKEAMRRMRYGTNLESTAKQSYQGLVPHEQIKEYEYGFAVWGEDELHSWLGASPDALVTILPDMLQQMQASAAAAEAVDPAVDGAVTAAAAAATDAGAVQHAVVADAPAPTGAAVVDERGTAAAAVSAAAGAVKGSNLGQMSEADWVKQQTGMSLEGVLEIKCPFKYGLEGKDSQCKEMPLPEEYYMMQVQTQLEVLDREWAVIYYWSPEVGSRMTLIQRDRGYFAVLWQVMADFWYLHVAPAKHILAQYKKDDPQRPEVIRQLQAQHEPRLAIDHPYVKELRRLSKKMVGQAPTRTFTAEETQKALQAGRLVIPDEEPKSESEGEDPEEDESEEDEELNFSSELGSIDQEPQATTEALTLPAAS